MTLAIALAFGLHQLATVIWVGGMFLAHMALRPAAKEALKGSERLALMQGVFRRFFPWVWVCILTLWGTGLWRFLIAAEGKVGPHVHVMMGLAALMTVIFVYLYFFPYRKFRRALEYEDLGRAGTKLGLIRALILVNLLLGLVTALVGSAGRLVVAI
jgi:uncharacterized membrane protein